MSQLSFEEKVIDAFQAAGAAITKYEGFYREKQAQQQLVESKVPEVVDALISNGRIEAEERKEAAAALLDHATALELLKKAAYHRNADEDTHLGEQVDKNGQQKKASAGLPSGGYVGRRTAEKPSSWQALERGIGLG